MFAFLSPLLLSSTGVLSAPHATTVTLASTTQVPFSDQPPSYSKATPVATLLLLPLSSCSTLTARQPGRTTPFPDSAMSASHVSQVPFFRPSLQPKQHQPQRWSGAEFRGMFSTG
ncbi:long-chain-alcohol oxidase FAO4A-like [Iris pallida]|uniref:Long-chain-alcohol oxidase FAO4A-like n=1 Tax=Iris pallida TaxID=29817 RepID=A0AAX6FA73_IRIPA|nr:long-chain-alcohol oxidase FAO4A-like [Iris pallida]